MTSTDTDTLNAYQLSKLADCSDPDTPADGHSWQEIADAAQMSRAGVRYLTTTTDENAA